MTQDPYASIRDEVAKLCAEFPGEYWRAKDRERAYPGEFVDALTKAGIAVSSHKEESQGKVFWSVTARGDAAMLAKIKAAGFADAYFLKRG